MGIMSGALLKGSVVHPRPYIKKMHCTLQVDRGKEANILQVLWMHCMGCNDGLLYMCLVDLNIW
jgi:hypothetical protein